MKIRVADITEKEKHFESTEEVERFPELVDVESSGECRFLEPLRISVDVVSEYGYIKADGHVATKGVFNCSRCLAEYKSDLVSTFTIYYSKGEVDQPDDEDEVELEERDLITVGYSGDEIDLSIEAVEQVLLEVPYKPLCSDECKGLCPTCGIDLNSGICSCSDKAVSMAFSALEGLKLKQ